MTSWLVPAVLRVLDDGTWHSTRQINAEIYKDDESHTRVWMTLDKLVKIGVIQRIYVPNSKGKMKCMWRKL